MTFDIALLIEQMPILHFIDDVIVALLNPATPVCFHHHHISTTVLAQQWFLWGSPSELFCDISLLGQKPISLSFYLLYLLKCPLTLPGPSQQSHSHHKHPGPCQTTPAEWSGYTAEFHRCIVGLCRLLETVGVNAPNPINLEVEIEFPEAWESMETVVKLLTVAGPLSLLLRANIGTNISRPT